MRGLVPFPQDFDCDQPFPLWLIQCGAIPVRGRPRSQHQSDRRSSCTAIIGYDSGKQQTDAIKNGLVAGAITQDPIGIGYKCVEAAVKALNGEEVPEMIDTGFHWYTSENIDSDTIKPLLYE